MQKGFTLLEMLIALFIISLLLTLALPAWQQHSQQTILQKEQQKLYVFLRQIQARVENSTDIWLLLANRDPVGKRWCLTAQIKNSHLCDCLNPVACPQNVSAHFYYPAFAETVLVSKRYYPLEFNQWGNVQRKSAVEIYQRFQAIQIAENQHQRRFLGLPCESQVQQNQIRFQVICSQNQVSVKYPRGEISL